MACGAVVFYAEPSLSVRVFLGFRVSLLPSPVSSFVVGEGRARAGLLYGAQPPFMCLCQGKKKN